MTKSVHYRVVALGLIAAVVLLAIAPALPTTAARPIPVSAVEIHSSIERERIVELPIGATHVALHWRGEHDAEVTAALRSDGHTFSPARAVEHDEVGEQRGDGETYGAVMLALGATAIRVTSDRPLARLSVLALDAGTGLASGGASAALGAVAQPPVISRAGWGADESKRFDSDGNELWIPRFYDIQKLLVHHTATDNNDPDPAATVRAIYHYHAVTQGWGDIGYNFLIDEAGRIYEGRYSREYDPLVDPYPTGEDETGTLGVGGAHAQNYNAGTVGVSLLGTLTSQDAAPAARDALEYILAWKAERHDLDALGAGTYTNPVNGTSKYLNNISGHRDVASTECPGGVFYNTFPSFREYVASAIAGMPDAAPQAPSMTASLSGNAVQLKWTRPRDGGSGITQYRVYRGTTSSNLALVATVPYTTLSYKDSLVKRRTTYVYAVSAVNALGEGARSSTLSVKTR